MKRMTNSTDLARRRTTMALGLVALGLTGTPLAARAVIAPASAAPDFTLHAMTGPNMRLQEQRGRVVMINFWATWCGPCRQEMPKLNKIYEKYGESGFVLM